MAGWLACRETTWPSNIGKFWFADVRPAEAYDGYFSPVRPDCRVGTAPVAVESAANGVDITIPAVSPLITSRRRGFDI